MVQTDIDKYEEFIFELRKQHGPAKPAVLTRAYWTTLLAPVVSRLHHRRET